MTPEARKLYLQQEEARLERYQHQHRGLRFLKFFLPPSTDRPVNLVGRNSYIYKGKIRKVPLDQLPDDIEPESINEEKLFEEIRDMSFPPIPPQEPLGPARRVGGKHTTTRRLSFAPVRVLSKEKVETPVLGLDGAIYRGTARRTSIIELDRQLRGSKRPISVKTAQSSSRGYVAPSVVALRVEGKHPAIEKPHSTLIALPSTDVRNITELIEKQSKAEKCDKDTTLDKLDVIKSENEKTEEFRLNESKPEVNEEKSEGTEPENIESEVTQSEATESEISDSEATELEENETEGAEAEETEDVSTELEEDESEGVEPDEAKTEDTNPEISEPEEDDE